MGADLAHWPVSWPMLIGYAVLAGWHLAGLPRLLRGGGRELRREAVLFQLGLAIALLAVVSPVGYLSGVYLWVRALQELLLAVVAPGLIVLGAPWAAFRLALGRPPWTAAEPEPGQRLTARPVLAVVAANVVWLAWQLPALVDAAQASSLVALAEHVSVLTAGLLFWLQLLSSRPLRQRTTALRRMALLVGTVAAATVVGMMLVFGSGVLYPAYVNSAHHVMSLLDDQQLAGAVWWMGILPPMIVAAVALMTQWLADEEPAGLDRLLTRRRHGWPSRPVIR